MKKVFIFLIASTYLILFLFSFIVIMKPGASIFYHKDTIPSQEMTCQGQTCEFQIKYPLFLLDSDSIVILEDQRIFDGGTLEYTQSGIKGSFSVKHIYSDLITLIISPTVPTDSIQDHTYEIYIRPHIIKRKWGVLIFVILSIGIIRFLYSNLRNSSDRRRFLRFPLGPIQLWYENIERILTEKNLYIQDQKPYWKRSIAQTILAAYCYVFMEWLFQITKPSFMDDMQLWAKVKILLISGLFVTLLIMIFWFVLFLLQMTISKRFPLWHHLIFQISAASIWSCLFLILIDNFTYTVLRIGILSVGTLCRVLYAVIFLTVFLYLLKRLSVSNRSVAKDKTDKICKFTAGILVIISFVMAGFVYRSGSLENDPTGIGMQASRRPNVILLSTDGLNASHMSVYGYERDTTPFITELAKNSLISRNHFTNSSATTGSITSVLTGKNPLTTHVLKPAQALMGLNMYQHLPWFMKVNGYQTISIGIPYYVDVNVINFKNAFDEVNQRNNTSEKLISNFSSSGYDSEMYFLVSIFERINDRLRQIFFIKSQQSKNLKIPNFNQLTGSADDEQLDYLFQRMDTIFRMKQPLFVQIHLLGTHGEVFNPSDRVFSKDLSQNEEWMTDFYDDAILNFDHQTEKIVEYLKENGEFDNTLLVIYSDHGQHWTTTDKLPLIIHFPEDAYQGILTANTQNVDIAPTILDYMQIPIPSWMEGNSLIQPLDPVRLIVAPLHKGGELVSEKELEQQNQNSTKIDKPNDLFRLLTIIQCQNWYLFDLDEQKLVKEGVFEDHSCPCSVEEMDSLLDIEKKLGKILTLHGYPVPAGW